MRRGTVIATRTATSVTVRGDVRNVCNSGMLIDKFKGYKGTVTHIFSTVKTRIVIVTEEGRTERRTTRLKCRAISFGSPTGTYFRALFLVGAMPSEIVSRDLVVVLRGSTVVVSVTSGPNNYSFRTYGECRVGYARTLNLPNVCYPGANTGVLCSYVGEGNVARNL